ncbi:hypothetical protein G9O61_00g021420 [Vairimorpha ceranae]|nr:hypothetical protein G9O61_00g021420 [Vairimorpha ceranae]
MKFWTCLEEPFEIKKYTFILNSAKKSCSVCEIKTPEGSRVVEKIYNFSKKLESGIEKVIQVKPDGTVRATTNLMTLSKLIEQDKYLLPRIYEILCNLRDMTIFSKLDLKDGFFRFHWHQRIDIKNI